MRRDTGTRERLFKGSSTHYVDVEWEVIIDPDEEALLSRDILRKEFPKVNWDTQVSGINIDDQTAEELEEVWNTHVGSLGTYQPIPDDDDGPEPNGAEGQGAPGKV